MAPVIAERIELGDLNPREEYNGFLQTPFWARQKERFGWKAEAVRWKRGEEKGTLLILIRSLPGGLALAYVPGGPDAAAGRENREDFLVDLSRELRGILPLGCFFIRYDLPEFSSGEQAAPAYPESLKKAPLDIQPPDTVVLDLRSGYEALLPGMHKKHRYNIRLAAKKGVTVKKAGREKLADWYELYRITSERDKIAIHPYKYYERLFELVDAEKEPELVLYLAYAEGALLAGIIVLFNGKEVVYLYGASSNEKRNLMPAYALQSAAIQDACKAGAEAYDLFGCPPSADPEHPMAGLYRFKTGFGGELRHRPGAWDYPYSRLFYLLYRGMEAGRRWYYKVWKKR
ncbi:MAG: peptidoglycan bridge formation glycyltransferase FemA/FemB family protein [Spirochaetales bacterium]|nr:peptidoglycan bridge formation glycyltransferase FemA/FemB family protein [Spirochaetales bacterium]